jgi:DNA-binding GntR family transcriptional regulator
MKKKDLKKHEVTLSDQVYDQLIDLIANGEIKPASVVSHRQLAETLKISKQPINFALKRLEREGIVESLPRIGTRILPVDAEEMWGMLQWRVAMESHTVALACEWAKPEQLEILLQKARQIDKLPWQGIPRNERIKADVDFHLYLAECSGCRVLRDKLSSLNIFYLKSLLFELFEFQPKEKKQYSVTHTDLARAIQTGKTSHAVLLLKKHLEESPDMLFFTTWYRKNRCPKQAIKK